VGVKRVLVGETMLRMLGSVYAECSTRDVGVIGRADGNSRGCMSDGCAHPAEGEGRRF
jgi:hypothetical protein